MQSDEIIWSVINHEFCAYKTKTIVSNFCRNKYNITGLCSRSSCPLANSRYATILEEDGVCYLYMKTIERAHTPKNMWEKIRLKRSYVKALKQIDSHLEYWPKFLLNKAKLRITKIHQYLIRSRRFMNEGENTTIEIINKRRDKQDGRREARSLRAIGDIEDNIKKELLDRLKKGVYEDIYNFSQANFEAALSEQKEQDGMEDDEEYVEDYDDDDEEEDDEEEDGEEDDGEEDIEDTTGELEYEFDEGEDEFEDLLKGGEDDDEVDLAGDSDDEDDDDDEEDIQRFSTPITVKTVSALKKRAKPTGGKPSALPPAKKARANVVIQYENETESSSSRARETN